MTENFRISSHCRFSLKYHFVWVTKYRKPILRDEVGYRLRTLFRELCQQPEDEIIAEYTREQDNERPLENGDDHFSVS